MWVEPQIMKFVHEGETKIGKVSTQRLNTLREYSKCLFVDDSDDDSSSEEI